MPHSLVILGTHLLAEEFFDLISDMRAPDGTPYEITAFAENWDRALVGKELEGRPILWIDDAAARFARTHRAICALSTTHRKGYVEQATALGFRLATLVHPTARVSSRATLAEGCFISALATIATRTTLGKSVFVNRSAAIGHHTTIGDYCTIQPRANIAGAITIGEQTYIGMGANIIDRLTIGKGCLIAAGATVVNNLPDRVLAMGVPAKVVKENIEPK